MADLEDDDQLPDDDENDDENEDDEDYEEVMVSRNLLSFMVNNNAKLRMSREENFSFRYPNFWSTVWSSDFIIARPPTFVLMFSFVMVFCSKKMIRSIVETWSAIRMWARYGADVDVGTTNSC